MEGPWVTVHLEEANWEPKLAHHDYSSNRKKVLALLTEFKEHSGRAVISLRSRIAATDLTTLDRHSKSRSFR